MTYTPTTWTSGLPITVARLNNIETGIDNLDAAIGAASGIAPLGADSKVPAANLPALGTSGQAEVLGTLISTTSTSYVDAHASLSITITTSGRPVLVSLEHILATLGSSSHVGFDAVSIDGVDYPLGSLYGVTSSGYLSFSKLFSLSAGSHTFKARIKASSGATYKFTEASLGTASGMARLIVQEI